MPVNGLNIIAEKINDSVPSTNKFFIENNYDALVRLAKEQADEGAAFIDINIGSRPPSLMAELVRRIQDVTDTPIAIDSPDPEIAAAGLEAYDAQKARNKKPLLNSISMQRVEMFDLIKLKPAKVILMASERKIDNEFIQNKSSRDIHESALEIFDIAQGNGIDNNDIIFDPTIAPVGTDYQGLTKMTVEGIEMIGRDKRLQGCHMSVGLSNFSVQLPSKTQSGALVKTPLENAFLTLCMPNGLDYCIGSTKKKYQVLADDHPALVTLKDILKLDGYDILSRVQEFYSS